MRLRFDMTNTSLRRKIASFRLDGSRIWRPTAWRPTARRPPRGRQPRAGLASRKAPSDPRHRGQLSVGRVSSHEHARASQNRQPSATLHLKTPLNASASLPLRCAFDRFPMDISSKQTRAPSPEHASSFSPFPRRPDRTLTSRPKGSHQRRRPWLSNAPPLDAPSRRSSTVLRAF